jgi:hypothetical protein
MRKNIRNTPYNMPTFTNAKDLYEYLFDDTLENEEGELYIIVQLLYDMTGYMHKSRVKNI